MNKHCVAGVVLALASVFQTCAIRVNKVVNSPRAIEEAQKTFEHALANNDTKTARDLVARLKKIGQTELALQLNSKLKDQKYDESIFAVADEPNNEALEHSRRSHPSKRGRKNVQRVALRQAEKASRAVAVRAPVQVEKKAEAALQPAPELSVAYAPKPEADHAAGSSKLMAERLMQAIQAEQQVRDELYATSRKLVMAEQDVANLKNKEHNWQSNQAVIHELTVSKEELDRKHAEAQQTVALLEAQVNSLKQVEELAESVTRENEELYAQTQELKENNQELTGQLQVAQCELEVTQNELKNADVILNKTPRELAQEYVACEQSAREAEQRCVAQAEEHNASIQLLERDLQRTEQLLSEAEQERQNTKATLESIRMAYTASENKCSEQAQEVGRCLTVIAQLEQDLKKSETTQEQLEGILAQGKQKYMQLAESARNKVAQLKADLKESADEVSRQAEQLQAQREEHELVCAQLAQAQDVMQGHEAHVAELNKNLQKQTEEMAALAATEKELRACVQEKDQLLAKAVEERDTACAEYDSANQQIAVLEQELLGWSMRCDELVNNHTEKVHSLTQKLASAESVIQEQKDDFRAQVDELKSKRKEAVRRATKTARAKVEMLQENNNTLKVAVNQLQEERRALQKEYADMEVAMQRVAGELDRTSKELAAVDANHDALCQKYALLNQQLNSASSSLESVTDERDQLKRECSTLEQRVCSLQQDLATQEEQWRRVSGEKNDMLASVKKLTEELAALRTTSDEQLAALRTSSNNELQAQAEQLKNKSKQAIQAIMQTANEKLEVFKQKNAQLEAALMHVESEKREKQVLLQEQLDAMKHMLAEKDNSMKQTHEKQAKVSQQKQALEQRYSKLNGDLQELSKELSSTQDELAVACNEKNELQSTCDELNLKVSSLKQQLHEQVEGVKQKGQQKIQTIVQAANSKLDALKEENHQLKAALASVEQEQHQKRLLLEEQLESLKNKFAELSSSNKSAVESA